ncbi:dermonecrotic toxin domain-containing protein [Pseudomonas sp. B22129]|uniref:dermonecrotic toxin domain-containing protein n=1 Tax=Pseudomonas sp. B22129 TaxID=3235111 RepID=UPI003784ADC7
MTSTLETPFVPVDTHDFDDAVNAEVAAEAALRAIRDQLKWRINTCTHPSRLINRLCVAETRCRETTQTLTHLIGRSPRILKVVRAQLYMAFNEEPDNVLFTVPAQDGEPEKVDSLTDRAFLLLFQHRTDASVHASTTLSLKGKPGYRLMFTPLEALQRVRALNLFERLALASTQYWNDLTYGSWLTRRELWASLHKELFADRAWIARQLDELSSTGMALVQAVIDAPSAELRQCAGGDWAQVRVGGIMWPGTPSIAIPGALHIYRAGDPSGAPHILYLPGVARNFHEYASFVALQCGVLELGKSRFDELWQCLPLNRRHVLCRPADLSAASSVIRGLEIQGDALALETHALLRQQWDNELACAEMIYHKQVFAQERPRPVDAAAFLKYVEGNRKQLVGGGRLGEVRDELLKWDHQRRQAEIIFASSASGLALRTVEQQVERYEKGIVALLDPDDPGAETPAYQAFVAWVSQLKVYAQTLATFSQGARQRLLDVDFWSERLGGADTPRRVVSFMRAQTEALRCEVQLQHSLKLLSTAHRDLMIEVLDQPLPARRPNSQTQVLSIAIGSESQGFYSLHNAWVVTTAAAVRVPKRQLPVVLYVFGEEGGLIALAGLDALTRSVNASLASRDDSVLWGVVARDKRYGLRAHAARQTLEVRYVPIDGKPTLVSIKKLLGSFDRLYKSNDDITRIFSEVKDAELSRALLLTELEQQLQVPGNHALNRAQTNIELLREAALEAKKQPAWLTGSTPAKRKHFRRLQRRYMSNAWAFLAREEQRLPDLNSYARQALTARLHQEGISLGIEIDEPFMAMSGDIHGTYCDHEEACLLKDPQKILPPSSSCRAFSLLELALQNLDPLAPWTQYKLNRACPLRWTWPSSLSTGHLRQMMSSLDIGGRYDALIKSTFYPPANPDHSLSEGRIPELLNRVLHTGAEYHLFCAVQRGLSANAQSVFSTAMAARTPQDLFKHKHELQLHVVHLVGHTMQHDRYVTGIVVVQDKRSQLCVVYWPQAPHALVLTEYAGLESARVALNRLGALPGNAKTLARQIAPGWAFQAGLTSFLEANAVSIFDVVLDTAFVKGVWRLSRALHVKHQEPSLSLDETEEQVLEQIASDPQDWLAIVASSNCDVQALLYRAHVHKLQRQAQAASYSNKALEEYRIRRLRDESIAKTRMVLSSFVPIIGMFSDIYEMYLAARRYQRTGDSRDKDVLANTIKFFMVGLVMTFIPGPQRAGRAATAVRSAMPPALRRLRRWRVEPSSAPAPAPSVRELPGLERFKVKSVPEGAVALKGPGQEGVYVKNGELFVADGTHHYPAYRRANEPLLRVRNQQAPGQDELIINIHESREWLLGADAPQPAAGTSSGVLDPWTAPVSPAPDWWPPIVRSATENRILQSTTPALHWLDWRMQIPISPQLSSPAPGIFHVPVDAHGFSYNALRVAPIHTSLTDPTSGFYRLLPQGNQAPLHRIVFITKNEQLVSLARVDIERWTSTDFLEQPLAASRTPSGGWQLHAPLFEKPLTDYVAEAFPAMTSKSREFTVARMIELAGPSRPATATHMLNIRATLDDWLPPLPAKPGRTDDILKMLRPTERGKASTFISYQGAAPGFTRVDFTPPFSLDRSLQHGGKRLAAQRNIAQRKAVRRVLEEQGFTVREFEVVRGGRATQEAIANHINSPNRLYYVSYHWFEQGHVFLGARLTDNWFVARSHRYINRALSAEVSLALREQRLVRILAGIQWPVQGRVSATVYFTKLTP